MDQLQSLDKSQNRTNDLEDIKWRTFYQSFTSLNTDLVNFSQSTFFYFYVIKYELYDKTKLDGSIKSWILARASAYYFFAPCYDTMAENYLQAH